ncbi:unnamed protein product [Mycena citricolor]|uniref:Uncharacterized protein n=1 Tax=Mycena citricolor TaxID=2018698 RepID=A0AAD2HYN7_9AGAR|nr:unnamed protein product [Mycena citricolor]
MGANKDNFQPLPGPTSLQPRGCLASRLPPKAAGFEVVPDADGFKLWRPDVSCLRTFPIRCACVDEDLVAVARGQLLRQGAVVPHSRRVANSSVGRSGCSARSYHAPPNLFTCLIAVLTILGLGRLKRYDGVAESNWTGYFWPRRIASSESRARCSWTWQILHTIGIDVWHKGNNKRTAENARRIGEKLQIDSTAWKTAKRYYSMQDSKAIVQHGRQRCNGEDRVLRVSFGTRQKWNGDMLTLDIAHGLWIGGLSHPNLEKPRAGLRLLVTGPISALGEDQERGDQDRQQDCGRSATGARAEQSGWATRTQSEKNSDESVQGQPANVIVTVEQGWHLGRGGGLHRRAQLSRHSK